MSEAYQNVNFKGSVVFSPYEVGTACHRIDFEWC